MKVPHKIMLEKEKGDIALITKEFKISRPTVTKALNTGIGSRKTVNAIIEFYAKQKDQLNKINEDDNN